MGEVSFGVGSTEFLLEIGKGNKPGHSIVNKIGNNPVVSTVEEDVWGPGGVLIYPTANETWEMVSADANDTSAGTGAQEVTIRYLDDAYIEQTPIVLATNGGTISLGVSNSFRHICSRVTKVGSGGENAGNITFQVLGGGDTRGQINATENETQDSHFTVPAGKTGFIDYFYAEINKNEDIRYRARRTDGDNGIFRTVLTMSLYQSNLGNAFPAPSDALPEKTDYKLVGKSSNLLAEANIITQFIVVDNSLVNL